MITLLDKGICRVFGDSVPYHGDFTTTETNPQFLASFKKVCDGSGTKFHAVSASQICDADMVGFCHFEYKDNVAIALKVAELLGIDRTIALAHMKQCLPDPGAFRLQQFEVPMSGESVNLTWANLFAINDIVTFGAFESKIRRGTKSAGVENEMIYLGDSIDYKNVSGEELLVA